MKPPSLRRKPASVVAYVRGRVVTLVAWDARHNELWRRNDTGAARTLAAYQRHGKTEVFVHHER